MPRADDPTNAQFLANPVSPFHVVGDVVANRFVIESHAGTGGMAVVYRAFDRLTQRIVALKELLVADEDLKARFRQEAALLQRVQHPNIVGYVDSGVNANGLDYLVMDWLEGEDLCSFLGRKRLSINESLQIVKGLAVAVAALHAADVIHRDLKPANIFLEHSRIDGLRVIDLGIALPVTGPRYVTAPGMNLGTPAYMAPEQIRAERSVSPAADIYSIGCVLFECITGRVPFVADHPVAVMVKALFEEAPRLRVLIPNVPLEIDDLCARLLSKLPELRPSTAADLVSEFQAISRGQFAVTAHVETILPGVTENERTLISVVVACPPGPGQTQFANSPNKLAPAREMAQTSSTTLVAPDQTGQFDLIHSLAELYGAKVEVLRDGSLAAVMTADRSPMDMATIAARCAIALGEIDPDMRVALATGWDVIHGRQPLGLVVDRAVSMLKVQDDAHNDAHRDKGRPILLDAMTAALLGDRFIIDEGSHHSYLFHERTADGRDWNHIDERTPFLGREQDQQALIDLVERAKEGPSTQIIAITGDAGIGKSRLCREALSEIESRWWPITIWRAAGDAISPASPLGPLRRMIRSVANLHDGEALTIQQQKFGAWIARHVRLEHRQRVTEFVGEAIGIRFRDRPSPELAAALLDGVLMGDQVRRALLDLVQAECNAAPLIILLEDLQWSDAGTIETIEAIARNILHSPLVVIATGRPEVNQSFPHLFTERPTTRISLSPLSGPSCQTLTQRLLGDNASDSQIQRIVERSSGNAFYLLELIRAARDGNESDIPLSLLGMTQRRLSSLEPDIRRILRAASIFGHVFWRKSIEPLVPIDERIIDEAITKLEQDRLIWRRASSTVHGDIEFMFSDSLLREAAYVMLTDADRRIGHRLAGEWLSKSGETDAVVLATHYDRGGASDIACQLYETAAEQSLAASDFAAVAELCARSIHCGATGRVLGAVRRLQAEIAVWRGDFQASQQLGTEALQLLPPGSSSWYVAAGVIAWGALAVGDVERLLEVAGQLLGRIDLDPGQISQLVVLARVSAGLYRSAHGDLAEKLRDALIQISADQRQNPIVAANLDEAAGWRAVFAGDRVLSYEQFQTSAQKFAQAGDVRNQIRVGSNAAALRMMLGDHQEAATDLRRLLQLSVRLELENVSANIKQNLGLALSYLDEFEEARQLEEEAIASFLKQGDRGLECAARIYLANILSQLDLLDEAEHQATDALAIATNTPAFECYALAMLADIKCRQGSIEDAYECAQHSLERLDELGTIEEGEAFARLTFVDCALRTGRTELAMQTLRKAVDRLTTEAQGISDENKRNQFLLKIPEHRKTLELAATHLPHASAVRKTLIPLR